MTNFIKHISQWSRRCPSCLMCVTSTHCPAYQACESREAETARRLDWLRTLSPKNRRFHIAVWCLVGQNLIPLANKISELRDRKAPSQDNIRRIVRRLVLGSIGPLHRIQDFLIFLWQLLKLLRSLGNSRLLWRNNRRSSIIGC